MSKTKKDIHELTRDQAIALVFDKYQHDRQIHNISDEIPAHLNYQIGDTVEFGHIKGLVIASIQSPLVLLENTQVEESTKTRNSNQTVPFMVVHWSEIVLHKNIKPTSFSKSTAYRINYTNTGLDGLLSSIMRRGLNNDTDFQRGYAWTLEDNQRLIQSIFEGKDIGKFIFLEDKTYKDVRFEVLDGKQRIHALLSFISNEFAYQGVYYHELAEKDRYAIDAQGVQYASLDKNQFSRKELLELFLTVNDAGVPQTPEHLQHVRDLLQAELEQENDVNPRH